MSIWDWIIGNGSKQALREAEERIEELTGDLAMRAENMSLFEERLAELELSLEDEGWQRLGGAAGQEFFRQGLKIINHLARLYFLKNPLIRRAILTQTSYVFGQSLNIQAKHPLIDEAVQTFLDHRANKAELTEHQALMVKETELQCFGNLFFVFFTNQLTGQVQIRTIPMDEIEEIVTNPQDAKDPWYYKRIWTSQGIDPSTGGYVYAMHTAYYPDWRYHPIGSFPGKIGGHWVEKDTPIYHVSVNRLSDMKFGVSEVYAALDWARAYKEFLENWATIVKAYARFAWKISTKGGAAGVSSAKVKLESTLRTGQETNPPPVTGSTFIGTEGIKMDPIRTAGATTKAEGGRYLRLMVCSATGIFDHYLTGDPTTGNLATAKTMELPMLIMFRDRQQLWISILEEILDFVVEQAVRAGRIPGAIEKDVYGDETVVLANDKENEDPALRDKPINDGIDIDFPNILEKDIEARVNAVVAAATLDGKPAAGTMPLKLMTKLLLEALGLDNVGEILDEMFPPEEEGQEKPPDVEEMFTSAVRKLHQALAEVIKR